MSIIVYNISDADEGIRIDKYIADQEMVFSRSYVQKLIGDGRITVNEKIIKPSYQLRTDDQIIIEVPEMREPEILPENIDLDILYEDADLIVVNKPKGMVVHPAAGHYSGTLVNALMYHCKDLSGINGIMRPGIVHRIDKDTSGILVCAKSDFAHRSLADQLKEHSITRKYEAICCGKLKESQGTINGPIGRNTNNRKLMAINLKNGKDAVTNYHVIEEFNRYTYIECILETGRTHQIRVHMASIGHPLLGDIAYGGRLSEYKLEGQPLEGQTLHAKVLGFIHPRTNKYMQFETELPEYFRKLLKILQ